MGPLLKAQSYSAKVRFFLNNIVVIWFGFETGIFISSLIVNFSSLSTVNMQPPKNGPINILTISPFKVVYYFKQRYNFVMKVKEKEPLMSILSK